jgi:outer membrane receptor protein involved in Fe transport
MAAALGISSVAVAQSESVEEALEEITVTGTRITNQNVVAASPVTTIGLEEINLNMTPNVERIFRDLPITIPGDGENVNNGSAGQATLDLRGLGPERSLIMIDGKRLAPYDIDGIVTTDVIPINMLERVDIVTGGASAVYGSDALSGAINFVLRKNFEGVEFDIGYSTTDSDEATNGGGEDTTYQSVLLGVNFDDNRGNVTLGASHTNRGSILLSERAFGVFGVSSSTGSGLGSAPQEPPPECSGNTGFTTAHATGVGSTTAIPATLNLRSGNSYQFRDNGDLILGECARFNFNPFNYYQTPQERWQATTIGNYQVNDSLEFYARATFSSNESAFQIAPSGTFGTAFTIPVQNPFFNSATQTTIVDDLNIGAIAFVDEVTLGIDTILALPNPTPDELDTLAALQDALAADPQGFNSVGIQDQNSDGVFDDADSFTSTARRRTLELGPRTGIFNTDYFQYVLGARGELPGAALEGWNYDLSYQYGESDFVETRDGFTNLTNLALGINTVDPDQCITPQGVVTPAPCTPINIFGPVGSITDQQRDDGFFIAVASDLRLTTQEIVHGSVDGTIEALRIPFADDGLSLAFGFEFSELTASSNPDECLKLAPASCQGGAGGNRLPINGAYSSDEFFFEAILPIVQGVTFFENLSIEAGFRSADYDVQGSTESWKAGFSWEIFEGVRFRFMEQQAVRVANVGELFRPVTTGLDNATLDPCSIGNPNPPVAGSDLFNRCVSTGMLPSQVGQVPDIISGQVNIFQGTNPNALPRPEEASTTTFGVVWESDFIDFLTGLSVSLDYYNIEINDYIDTPTGQESLDLCYILEDETTCNGIVRIGGALGETGTGTPAFFTNFVAFEAEGIDLSLQTGFQAGGVGDFAVSWVAHQYLTNQFQTTALSPVVDCKGRYGTSCDPVPEFRSTFRVSWVRESMDASLLWRHIASMDAQVNEASTLFEEFRSVDSQNYLDLNLGYSYKDWGRFSFLVRNITDEDPPILGNETGSTSFNSGNTFPSLFDTMGRTYSVNLKVTF